MKAWWLVKIFKMMLLMTIAALAFGGIIMGLWNALVPELFHGPQVTFLQAIGLLILSHLLFRGAGGFGRAHKWRGERWNQKFEEKLAAMTPEERDKFKAEYRRRCGYWSHHEHPGTQEPTGGQPTN